MLITGGDPMVMRTRVLRRFVEPLLSPDLEHVQNIRIGTKAIAYWPQRFVSDEDADDCLRLFEEVIASGRHLALMGHYSHPVELEPQIARMAVQRIRSTGAQIRMQAPLIRHGQRQSRRLGRAVAHRRSPRADSVLHVRRARHRRAQLFRGATRALL